MSERYILAYFKSPEEAEGVSRKLKALRAIELSVDRFSRYESSIFGSRNPVTGNIAQRDSLTATTIYSGILASTDTSASGMSHGGDGGPTGRDILLTVILNSETYDQAIRLIEEAGGMI